MSEFSGKVVAVTGGNSGIGLGVAQRFSREGAKVAIFGRSQQKLDEAAKSLKQAIAIQGDVSKPADLDRFFQEVSKKLGKIDILVASAGVANSRHVQEVDEAFFDEIVNINYKGLYFSVQRALNHLNQNASVILISSASAHIGWPGHSVYGSTKAAASHLARTLSGELIDRGIRVNAISPGFIETPMTENFRNTPGVEDKVNAVIPAKRFGTVQEIAQAALFVASNPYMIGADLVIDGGISEIFSLKLD